MSAERSASGGGRDEARAREVLRQAGIALHDRVVTLWEISPAGHPTPLLSGVPNPPQDLIRLDLDATLKQWGAPIITQSRWVGCRANAESPLWCVAPVRSLPAAPPPGGFERRSRERLILELAGLCLGAIGTRDGGARRLSPAEALWEHSRQPSVIAHEVGNPLAVALGNLDLGIDSLRDAEWLDPAFRATLLEDLRNAAGGIEQAAEYLRTIQERPFAEIGAGRKVRFDMTPVIQSCVTLERPVARKSGVTIEWRSGVDSLFLFGESGALYQIVTNLIRNAVHASRIRKGSIVVTLERTGDMLFLAVRDEGEGIAPVHLDRIFEAGFTTKAPGAGSGLGLAVVRQITQSMFGGTVRVESRVGSGSTFTLALPIPPQRNTVRPLASGQAGPS